MERHKAKNATGHVDVLVDPYGIDPDGLDRASRNSGASRNWFDDQDVPKTSQVGPLLFSIAVFTVAFLSVLAIWLLCGASVSIWMFITCLVVAYLASATLHIAMEWERVCIMRFGAFNRVSGPGIYVTIPLIEQAALHVDQRVMTTPFYAEKTLTSDLVPVDVDAVLFWMVWDAQKACVEVRDYASAVSFVAQTAMREAIGRASIARVALQRDEIDRELQEALSAEVDPWGVSIIAVKVRDIVIPKSLQDVMSAEAQAERQKEARVVLADVEKEIAEMLKEAADVYDTSESALRLRTLHLLNETVKQSEGSVVSVPSAFSDGFIQPASK